MEETKTPERFFTSFRMTAYGYDFYGLHMPTIMKQSQETKAPERFFTSFRMTAYGYDFYGLHMPAIMK